MNKKIVVTRLLLSGHLIFCFNSSLFAGNFLASGSVGILPFFPKKPISPADDLPFFLKQATTTDKPLALILKQTDDDKFDDRFDDENKTKAFDKHDEPDDFDKLSMPFEYDSEDESELSPDNKREDSAKYHVILEWNDTEQKITCRQVLVATHELTEEKHLRANIDLATELAELKEELKAPEINATSIALPRASSPESVYPVTQNEKGESSEGEDSSSEDGGSDDNENEEVDDDRHSTNSGGSNNSEESVSNSVEELIHFEGHIPEGQIQAATDRVRADDGLTYLQVDDVRDFHWSIDNENILEECSLTEAGAIELQADNPQLFATPEAAMTAFEALKQVGIEKASHSLEHISLARLIDKYKSNGKAMDNLFSGEKKKLDLLDACKFDRDGMTRHIYESLLKPLQVTDDNESLLVICSEGSSYAWSPTEAGCRELKNRHPDLFQSDDAAKHFWKVMELSLECSTLREHIATHQYQAIAKLIQEYEQAGNVEFILDTDGPAPKKLKKYRKRPRSASDDALVPRKVAKTESSSFSESRASVRTYIDTIPYGMLRRGFFSFDGERSRDRKVSSKSKHKYELFLKPGKYFSKMKKFINNPILSQGYKISSLKQVFDEEPLTLTQFMKNIDSLLENFYEQTKELSEPDCSQINKPTENDRLNAPEGDHDQPDQKD